MTLPQPRSVAWGILPRQRSPGGRAVGLDDVTRAGVERALARYDLLGRDDFLARAGLGEAPGSFIVRGERRYEARPILAVAHGYDRPDVGPLRKRDLPRSEIALAERLEALGFAVERTLRNPKWAEEEIILALATYLRGATPDKNNEMVVDLSRELRALPLHAERPDAARFRNPNGVALKLANLAWLDPSYPGGMEGHSKLDAEVWRRYADDEDALEEAVAAIREGRGRFQLLDLDQLQSDDGVVLRVTEVEEQHVERLRVSVPGADREVERREQRLVLAYRDHLADQGHTVTRHTYRLAASGITLACDLVDETAGVLYEAKGDILRSSVRMAVGQLLDYRRFERRPMQLGVLLPRAPSSDLTNLVRSVPASAVWPTSDGFTTGR